jgi:hypothetical protein
MLSSVAREGGRSGEWLPPGPEKWQRVSCPTPARHVSSCARRPAAQRRQSDERGMSEMATTIDIAKGFRAAGACLAEVSPAELEQVEGGIFWFVLAPIGLAFFYYFG